MKKVVDEDSRFFHLPKVFSRGLLEKLQINEEADCQRDCEHRHFLDSLQTRVHQASCLPPYQKIEVLGKVLNLVVSRFTTHKPLLAEIKREYDLVLLSIYNHKREKEYLRGKIQKLICELGTPAMLSAELAKVMDLSYRLDAIKSVNDRLKKKHEKHDLGFIEYLGCLFEQELDEMQDETQKMGLKFRGKKAFINDWLNANGEKHDLLRQLQATFERGQYDDLDEMEKIDIREEEEIPDGQVKRSFFHCSSP
ncbi:hypothetical protein BC830DRAFT_1121667 [Chytriomyces sp. MP71]|nr:hypothetical protein BC830DRAFT_1121667 [Chytriomyces sp. MP71]